MWLAPKSTNGQFSDISPTCSTKLLPRYCAVLAVDSRGWLVRYNPAVGYCQSMNFIAALLLIILDVHEEHSFWMLVLLVWQQSQGLCACCVAWYPITLVLRHRAVAPKQ